MAEDENPYAAPREATFNVPLVATARLVQPRPGVSRFFTVCLAVNVVSWPYVILLSEIQSQLEGRKWLVAADIATFLAGLGIFWMFVCWPISSLATLIYTTTADRHTRAWLPKSIVAAVMLGLWTLGCGFIGLLVTFGGADDF